jgi:serine/threonine protein kinase
VSTRDGRARAPTKRLDARPFWEATDDEPLAQTAEVGDAPLVPTRFDGLVVGEVLGEGATAIVYAATDTAGRALALKVLLGNGDGWEALSGEARAMAAVRHPAIPRVERVTALPSGRPCLVMEQVDGRPLDEVLHREGPLPWSRVKALLGALLDALAALHARGLVHRDVKPGNLLVRPAPPGLALVDFGIARPLRGGRVDPTTAHVVRGTLEYMSPEQLAGGSLDARSDLFSAGVVAFEAVTGAQPWPGAGATLTERRQAMGQRAAPARPRQVPAADFAVLAQLLALDPRARPASAAEALERLTAR